MKKITLIACLFASAQIFGWEIEFGPSSHEKTYEILTFSQESDYNGMIRQISLGSSFIGFLGVVAPVAGKLGEYKVGQLKKESTDKESDKKDDKKESTAVAVATAAASAAASSAPKKTEERTYSDAEIELIKLAIKAASKGLEKAVKSGVLGDFFSKTTKRGYTIDYIKSFRPSNGLNLLCRDAQSLTEHVIHKVKTNKNIFYVIVDKETNTPLFADWGPAYGKFRFNLYELDATNSNEKVIIGDLELISNTTGAACTAISSPVAIR